MASDVSICNSALQKIGADRITSMTQVDSRNASSVNACYEEMRDAELRAHPWNFARKRVTLAPDSVAPNDTYAYAFSLPADCLRILPPSTLNIDWQVESRKILTNDGDSIDLKYIKRVTDANEMDVLFREMLACRIAIQVCEEITQSTSKLDGIARQYKEARSEARRTNAFEQSSDDLPEDSWVNSRL